MASFRHLGRRRLVLAAALAAALATEVTGFAVARSLVINGVAPGTSTAVATAPAVAATSDARLDGPLESRPARVAVASDLERDVVATAPPAPTVRPKPAAPKVSHPAVTARPAPRATTTRSARAAPKASTHHLTVKATYRGSNHVWIPWLGISSGVQSFPCSRSRPPDAGVYRWGCAGHDNVYLMGHAWSTFRALHDAYVAGRLRPGLAVWYADGAGHVHEYRIAWWKLVAPTTAASWAWAAQSRPSMTLQTCVGANSQYRLMVRLLQVS